MSFQPVLPLTGFAGWGVLKRTMAKQQAAFQKTAITQREEEHFREKIGSIDTAAQLVDDRQLLKVALGAYGLDGDINNKAFIRKVLEDGTLDTTDLSQRLADKQYQAFSSAFGFGNFDVPRSKLSDFADQTIALYRTRQFETAVGEQNNDYRLAMNLERELPKLAGKTMGEDAKWFTIMGSTPMRTVFETALGLPASFASIDLDQQLVTLKDKADRLLGTDSVSDMDDPAIIEKLVKTFLLRSEAAAGPSATTPGMAALTLLQSRWG